MPKGVKGSRPVVFHAVLAPEASVQDVLAELADDDTVLGIGGTKSEALEEAQITANDNDTDADDLRGLVLYEVSVRRVGPVVAENEGISLSMGG